MNCNDSSSRMQTQAPGVIDGQVEDVAGCLNFKQTKRLGRNIVSSAALLTIVVLIQELGDDA